MPPTNYNYISALLSANINNESRAALFKKALFIDNRGRTIAENQTTANAPRLNQLLSDATQNLSQIFQPTNVALS